MSPGPPAAALGEEDGRQAHPLDQLEQPVLLAVAERALGPGQHRVVVGEHRAGGALAEELAVDARGAGDEAVGRRARDQVVDLAAAALGGDREAPVLDEGAGVDEVGDVLARRAAAGRVAARDGLGAGRVLGQRPARQQLGQVLALARRRRTSKLAAESAEDRERVRRAVLVDDLAARLQGHRAALRRLLFQALRQRLAALLVGGAEHQVLPAAHGRQPLGTQQVLEVGGVAVGRQVDADLELGLAAFGDCLALGGDQLLALGGALVVGRGQRLVGVLPLLGLGVPAAQLGSDRPAVLGGELLDRRAGALELLPGRRVEEDACRRRGRRSPGRGRSRSARARGRRR